VLRAAEGASNTAIAAALGLARHTVQHWRDRFATERLAGLRDRPHCPPPRRYPAPSKRPSWSSATQEGTARSKRAAEQAAARALLADLERRALLTEPAPRRCHTEGMRTHETSLEIVSR
jgi:hypothetical protein